MSDQDAFGPIDFILIEYPDDADTTACVDAITALVEQGTIRLYDVLLIRRAADGSYSGVDLGDATAASGFTEFEGARSGLIGDDDVSAVIEVMRPGTIAALIVFENAWAAPFVRASLNAGGEVIASQRIPASDVVEALDILEASHVG
ncbi:DUF6325 family protein [Pseudonocardia sp.]|uniref:DUF6325 family protein n=1 Tax=Pseudonocardia sp. TaxID=60912 RepID=UPI003D0AD8CE